MAVAGALDGDDITQPVEVARVIRMVLELSPAAAIDGAQG